MTSQLLASNWGPQYIFWDMPILYQDNFSEFFFDHINHSSQCFLGHWSGSVLSIRHHMVSLAICFYFIWIYVSDVLLVLFERSQVSEIKTDMGLNVAVKAKWGQTILWIKIS